MCTGAVFVVSFVCLLCFAAGSTNREACTGQQVGYGQDSEVVLTGTVLRLDRREGGRAEVRVKRVLKGPADLRADSTVRVEGVTGTPCHGNPRLRARDSRIFMLDGSKDRGVYVLTGSLLRITVPNLDRVSAVVKGEPYHRRPAILDLACEIKYCPWGGECVETRSGARCQCPETCPVGYAPVCGSNGATYVNECRLRRESCKSKTRIFLSHAGPCPTATG